MGMRPHGASRFRLLRSHRYSTDTKIYPVGDILTMYWCIVLNDRYTALKSTQYFEAYFILAPKDG